MSRASHKHEAMSRKLHRGPKNKADDEMLRGVRKTPKQKRSATKANLRKEWL